MLRRESQNIYVFRLRGQAFQAAVEVVIVVEEGSAGVLCHLFQDVHIGQSSLALILHFDVYG